MTLPPNDPSWLYINEAPPEPTSPFTGEAALGKAWQRLQVLHTPSRDPAADEYRWIVTWLARLERLFLERPDLEDYYQECFAPEADPGAPGGASPRPTPPRTPQVDHIATVQAQFMEEVFYTLALDRHANATDNRGWVNLFRRWGRSPRFNARLDDIRSLFTLQFLSFYDYYLRFFPCRIDEEPIPHPWDSNDRRADPRERDTLPLRTGGLPGPGECLEDEPPSRRREPAATPGPLPGLYLDSGIREAGSKPPRTDPHLAAGPSSARPGTQQETDQAGGTPRGEAGEGGNESPGNAPSRPNE